MSRSSWAVAAATLAAAGLAARVQRETHTTRVTRLELPDTPPGAAPGAHGPLAAGSTLRIAQVSDFHDLPEPAHIQDVLALAADVHPDIVAVTGDLLDDTTPDLARVEVLLEGLASIQRRTYVVLGNHDHAWLERHGSTGRDALAAAIRSTGATLLVDSHVSISGPFGAVNVVGVDDCFSGHGNLDRALRGVLPGAYTLVLTHSPQVARQLDHHPVDLVLCGHTHGGQVRLPLLGALVVPGGHAFVKGLYELARARMWVDSGVGWTSIPVRLLNPSQISAVAVHASRLGSVR